MSYSHLLTSLEVTKSHFNLLVFSYESGVLVVKLLNQQFLPHDGVCLRHLSGKMIDWKGGDFCCAYSSTQKCHCTSEQLFNNDGFTLKFSWTVCIRWVLAFHPSQILTFNFNSLEKCVWSYHIFPPTSVKCKGCVVVPCIYCACFQWFPLNSWKHNPHNMGRPH